MKINLKDAFLLDRYEKTIEFSLPVSEEDPILTDAEFRGEPKVRFLISGKYGMVHCETEIDLSYTGICCRCLEEVEGDLHIENRRRMITDPDKEDEDTILIGSDFFFFPEEEARNQIIMEFPVRFLCDEDCKGLCPVCGCNLNREQCDCEAL